MIRLIQRRLIIPQGDTGSFTIPVLPGLKAGDIAVFTIFDMTTKSKVYQKVFNDFDETLTVRFEHEDTANLPAGKFYWDIKIYQEPIYDEDNNLIGGKEVDSYYAAYALPECEIRLTSDGLK